MHLSPPSLRILLGLLAGMLILGAAGSFMASPDRTQTTHSGNSHPLSSSPTMSTALPSPTGTMPSLLPTPTRTPTRRPTPLPTQPAPPTQPPSPSAPGPLGYDSFDRSVPLGWGRATDGQLWHGDAASAHFAVKDDTGTVEGAGSWNALLGPTARDAEVLLSGSLDDFAGGTNNFGALLRWTDPTHWYKASLNGGTLSLLKQDGTRQTVLCSIPFFAFAHLSYTLRFHVYGSYLQAEVWSSALPEARWQISTTDTSLSSAGYTGLRFVLHDQSTVAITQFVAKGQKA